MSKILNFEKWSQLHEQTSSSRTVPQIAADLFCASLGKSFNDDEPSALKAVKSLTTADQIREFANLVNQKEKKSLFDFFNEYMSEADPEYPQIVQHIKGITYNADPAKTLDLQDKGSFNGFLRVVRQDLTKGDRPSGVGLGDK